VKIILTNTLKMRQGGLQLQKKLSCGRAITLRTHQNKSGGRVNLNILPSGWPGDTLGRNRVVPGRRREEWAQTVG